MRSSSCSAIAYWPISGCASSAFFTSTGSRVSAARDREPLVRGDVLRQAEQLGRERRLRSGSAPGRVDARRHLDDVVVREPGERAVVAHVDLVHGAVAGDERRDEPERGLAVERAAALLEQRRLLDQLRVAVQLEQLALDLGDGLRARHAVELLASTSSCA